MTGCATCRMPSAPSARIPPACSGWSAIADAARKGRPDAGQRGATQQLQTLVNDRLLAMQKSAESQRGDLVRLEALINDRLKTFERNVESAPAVDAEGPVGTGRPAAVAGEGDRNRGRSMSPRSTDDVGTAEGVRARPRRPERWRARSWSAMSDRLFALERAVSSQRADAANIQQLVAGEIKALEKSLVHQGRQWRRLCRSHRCRPVWRRSRR